MKKLCTQISVLTEIDGFSAWCFKDLPQVSSYPAYFRGEFLQGIKLNHIYTQLHGWIFPKIANKEIKNDKLL